MTILTTNTLITLLQALQLVALAPCMFVILFLLGTSRPLREVFIPAAYFTVLAAGFLIPLIEVWPAWEPYTKLWERLYGSLLFLESLIPAFSFLLIMQLVAGKRFTRFYWLILALPLIGGSGVVYASLIAPEVCIQNVICIESGAIRSLYYLIATALIFLLLVVEFARLRTQLDMHGRGWRDRYWLVISLVALNLVVLGVELAEVAGKFKPTEALFVITLLRMTFIYLVLTLLFRLFDDSLQGRKPVAAPNGFEREREIGEAFLVLMEGEQLYREPGCNREAVARQLGINENLLSRAISHCFNKRFTDVVNEYRVEEAKERLIAEPDKPVTDIAFTAGFNSIPSFNRVFKDATGLSPRQYRTEHKNTV